MYKKTIFSFVVTSLFLLISCVSFAKEIDKPEKSIAEIIDAHNKGSKDIYLQGKIIGDVNGEAFSYFDKNVDSGRLNEDKRDKTLDLKFSPFPTLNLKIHVYDYQGANTYEGGIVSFKLKKMKELKKQKGVYKNARVNYKNIDNSKLTIIEDDATHLKGSISFATVSDKNENIEINVTFNFTKVFIDPNTQEALLKVIKRSPSIIKKIGDLNSDKDFILKASSVNKLAFAYADESLKKDRDFALRMVKVNFRNINKFDKDLLKDKKFALKVLKIDQRTFFSFDKELRKDKDIIAAGKL